MGLSVRGTLLELLGEGAEKSFCLFVCECINVMLKC
jgi:hypothetical protein